MDSQCCVPSLQLQFAPDQLMPGLHTHFELSSLLLMLASFGRRLIRLTGHQAHPLLSLLELSRCLLPASPLAMPMGQLLI